MIAMTNYDYGDDDTHSDDYDDEYDWYSDDDCDDSAMMTTMMVTMTLMMTTIMMIMMMLKTAVMTMPVLTSFATPFSNVPINFPPSANCSVLCPWNLRDKRWHGTHPKLRRPWLLSYPSLPPPPPPPPSPLPSLLALASLPIPYFSSLSSSACVSTTTQKASGNVVLCLILTRQPPLVTNYKHAHWFSPGVALSSSSEPDELISSRCRMENDTRPVRIDKRDHAMDRRRHEWWDASAALRYATVKSSTQMHNKSFAFFVTR